MKRFIAFLTAAALLYGCGTPPAETAPETSASAAETSVSAAQTSLQTTAVQQTSAVHLTAAPQEKEPAYDLDSIPYGRLLGSNLICDEKVQELINIPENISDNAVSRISENILVFPEHYASFRYSSLQMGENSLSAAEKAMKRQAAGAGVYSGVSVEPVKCSIGKIKNGCVHIDSAEVRAYARNARAVRAFIRPTAGGGLEFIIDPAYMRGIPLFSSDSRYMTFDINEETVYADTLYFTVDNCPETAEELANSMSDSSRYCYAEFMLWSAVVDYDTESGYRNTARISEIRVITDGTSAVLSGDFIFEEENGLYRALTDKLDKYYSEEVSGIHLLDMDFDKEPELLVTRGFISEGSTADIDVYSIKDGTLTLAGTIRGLSKDASFSKYGCTAFLGLKPLPDGSAAWFAMTAGGDTDGEKGFVREKCSLYRLENGRLTEEELFSCREDKESQFNVYINGERLAVKKIPDPDGSIYTLYSMDTPWGEVNGFADYVLYYSLKNLYCEDIEQSFLMCSDWLVSMNDSIDGHMWINRNAFLPSERDIKIQLGLLIDAYTLGNYDSISYSYSYDFGEVGALKPIIYLYPEEETQVSVKVGFPYGGSFTCTYPEYGEGWEVTAMPDGTLYDKDGNEYYCLYWEGNNLPLGNLSEGWCVAGSETADFLREKLLYIGLTPREANEFIIYWLPQMQKNPYNLISFHFDDYDRAAPLDVSPAPDRVIRVFMTFEPYERFTGIKPQTLPRYERKGFTLVEWGGHEINS